MSGTRAAVVLAGGAGERFWPLSRASHPKQFLRLRPDGPTLLQATVGRLEEVVPAEAIYIATGEGLIQSTAGDCPHIDPSHILAEPCRRNTAGAIGWSMATLDSAATVGFFPADHAIDDHPAFGANVRQAFELAESTGDLITIGIQPTRAETGFGYIESEPDGRVSRFHEKPDAATAQSYLTSGRFLWNAGMFFWTADAFWQELQRVAPEYCATLQALRNTSDVPVRRSLFESLPSISIDHLLMERASGVRVVRAEFQWDDVGSLDALGRWMGRDPSGNTTSSQTLTIESHDNLVVTSGDRMVCLLGVDDLMVIETEAATLICPRDRAQDVKLAVQAVSKVRPDLV